VNELAQIVAEPWACVLSDSSGFRNEVKIAFSDHSKAEHIFWKVREEETSGKEFGHGEWSANNGARESSIFEG